MADEGTASTLILIGAILQIPFIVYYIALFFWMPALLAPLLSDPMFQTLLGMMIPIMQILYVVESIIGAIMAILWFRWRTEPAKNKTGLLITGIFGLIFTGVIPGLLVIIGRMMVPSVE